MYQYLLLLLDQLLLLLVDRSNNSTFAFARDTAQKMKFSIKDFFSKCDQMWRKLRIWSHLLKRSLMENFIFCAVIYQLCITLYLFMHSFFVRVGMRLAIFSHLSGVLAPYVFKACSKSYNKTINLRSNINKD